MITSDNAKVGEEAPRKICSTFSRLENKEQAWEDLLALTNDPDSFVRWSAADALGSVVQYLPDKEQAWEDLLALTNDPDSNVRWSGAEALDAAIQYLPDKEQVWKDLLMLTNDPDSYVRWRAAGALGSAFQHLRDKEQPSKDLLALTKNKDIFVRIGAAGALGSVFQYMPDKEQASKDLLALTKNKDIFVRRGAADALSSAFQYMPEKEQPSKGLLALTKDPDSNVRIGAADALGSVFQYMPEKNKTSKDLLALTKGEDSDVRVSANHSLGKISVYRATIAEDEDLLQKELENAIVFFEKSALESTWFNPAKFCLPFYRSYYLVIFKKQEAEKEVKKNLDEAKRAVSSSESREKLLEAVENLSNALNETQKLRDMEDIKADLNGYRRYCNRACELLDITEDRAPGATKLIRRGLPVIDDRIQGMLAEIRKKSGDLCKKSLGTPFEDLGKEVNEIGLNLLSIGNPIALEKQIKFLEISLSAICNRMPGKESVEACNLLNLAIDETYIETKLSLINMILNKIPLIISNSEYIEKIERIEKKLDEIKFSLESKNISEELVISVGPDILGTGIKHVVTIPIQKISYPELKEDLEKIKGMSIFNLAALPSKLGKKIKDYLVSNDREYLIEKLK